ncbi:MAG: hypothetical protein ACTHJ3_07610 [Pararhizobium sp.]
MNIIEVFLPLEKRSGDPIDVETIEQLVKDLADRFGGATAFTREPAEGLWKRFTSIERDRIVIVEVVLEAVDDVWWKSYKGRLEREFEQDEIMIRITPCRLL